MSPKFIFKSLAFVMAGNWACAQSEPLTLSQAVDLGLKNYQTIQAKRNYYNASQALKQNTKNEYLPNLIGSIQQDYGTVNGQYGPLGAVGLPGAGAGLAVASAGPVAGQQSWNAAFGGLYLLNVNWEFFTFGRVRSKIKMSGAQANRDSADLTQEQFVHSVRVASAYLNLLTTQRLIRVARSNLNRSLAVKKTVHARSKTGLNPGVDSSMANADLSRAKLALISAINNEQQNRNLLAQYLKTAPDPFLLDTTFFERVPAEYKTTVDVDNNPQVRFYKQRIEFSNRTATFLKRSAMPVTNFFSIIQSRGSGFHYNYSPLAPQNYSSGYSEGVNPTRSNFLFGLALSWNVMNLTKIKQQVNAQRYVSAAYQNEYDLISTQLHDQLI